MSFVTNVELEFAGALVMFCLSVSVQTSDHPSPAG